MAQKFSQRTYMHCSRERERGQFVDRGAAATLVISPRRRIGSDLSIKTTLAGDSVEYDIIRATDLKMLLRCLRPARRRVLGTDGGRGFGLNLMPCFSLEKMEGWEQARFELASSDCEPLALQELLALADDDSRERWNSLSLGYPGSTQGDEALREEIADGLYGGALRADQILGVVPSEGILLAMHAILRPGDHAVVMAPGYGSLFSIAKHALDCDVAPWTPEWSPHPNPSSANHQQVPVPTFCLERLRSLLLPNTKLVVANLPHNPTGFVPSPEAWQELIALCSERGLYLFCDEMFRHLEPTGRATLPAAAQEYDRAVSLSGLSKAYGLAGLRVGWLATRDAQVLRRCHELKDYTTICAGGCISVVGDR